MFVIPAPPPPCLVAQEIVETFQEVVQEMESQPKTNLLPEEIEEKFTQLMVRNTNG